MCIVEVQEKFLGDRIEEGYGFRRESLQSAFTTAV